MRLRDQQLADGSLRLPAADPGLALRHARAGGERMMLPLIGLLAGIALGLMLEPSVPQALQPYLPIAIVAAMDALFGALRAYLEGTSPTGSSSSRSCPTC